MHDLHGYLATYGYLAIFVIVGMESAGIPMPGETVLVAAAILAGEGKLHLWGVIGAAAAGAIVGDNCGYWVGREFGFPIVYRYGRYLRLDERRLKLGQYLFLRHGGKIVFFGRFVAVLRAFAAFLAGVNHFNWERFFFFNAAGGIVWATIFGVGRLLARASVRDYARPVGHCGPRRGGRRRLSRRLASSATTSRRSRTRRSGRFPDRSSRRRSRAGAKHARSGPLRAIGGRASPRARGGETPPSDGRELPAWSGRGRAFDRPDPHAATGPSGAGSRR